MTDIDTAWTEAYGTSDRISGQDHLSLESTAENLYDQVTPGFTNLARRARGNDAAVVWDNDDLEGNVRRIAMVLCSDQKAALEISWFSRKRPLVRLHRVTGGTPGNGVHLTGAQYLTYIWRQGLIQPVDTAQAALFRCAAELAPDLSLAMTYDESGGGHLGRTE